MKSSNPADPQARGNANRIPWLWIVPIGCLLIELVAVLLPRPRPTTHVHSDATNRTFGDNAERESIAYKWSPRFSATALVPVPTAEEIVAGKLSQFARKRRELAHALA